jgi:hypothetical protein
MATTLHKNLTGADAIHPAAYVQSTDPGAVGAAKLWVDTSSGAGTAASPYPLKKRNAGDTGWDVIGGVGSLSALSDATITSPAGGQSLVYDAVAAKWKNNRPPGASLYAARTCI